MLLSWKTPSSHAEFFPLFRHLLQRSCSLPHNQLNNSCPVLVHVSQSLASRGLGWSFNEKNTWKTIHSKKTPTLPLEHTPGILENPTQMIQEFRNINCWCWGSFWDVPGVWEGKFLQMSGHPGLGGNPRSNIMSINWETLKTANCLELPPKKDTIHTAFWVRWLC